MPAHRARYLTVCYRDILYNYGVHSQSVPLAGGLPHEDFLISWPFLRPGGPFMAGKAAELEVSSPTLYYNTHITPPPGWGLLPPTQLPFTENLDRVLHIRKELAVSKARQPCIDSRPCLTRLQHDSSFVVESETRRRERKPFSFISLSTNIVNVT